MNEIVGNFWEEIGCYDAICCTTNMVVKGNGELVMGKGIALGFKRTYTYLPKEWGERTLLIKNGKMDSNIIVSGFKKPYLVSFPTKYDWKDQSSLKLIGRSAHILYMVSQALGWNKILLTRPGCGNGGLDWEKEVKPVLEEIFDERFFIVSHPEKEK
jgi:hypothetical protein